MKILVGMPGAKYTQNGSRYGSGIVLNLFGSADTNYQCMRREDILRLHKTDCNMYEYLCRNKDYIGTPVFERLVSAYKRGNQDEAIYMGAKLMNLELDGRFVTDAFAGKAVIGVADEAEFTLLQMACRFALFGMNGHVETKNSPTEEQNLQQWLMTIAPDSKIRVVSATHIEKLPSYVKSFVLDQDQAYSSPPAVTLIPNNMNMCYAASTLTVLFSIPFLVKELNRTVPRCPDGATFINTMRAYAWFLNNGGVSEAGMRELNRRLVEQEPMKRFGHGGPDDSETFIKAVINALKKWSPIAASYIGQLYNIPSLKLIETVSVEVPAKTDTLNGDLEEIETPSPRTWTSTWVPATRQISTVPKTIKRVPRYSAKIGTTDVVGDVGEIFSKVITKPTPILFFSQAIDIKKEAPVFIMPCNIKIHGIEYSIHGSVLFDNAYSKGHYISMIVSNTSMYFYDSQYEEISEDPREYQPRLICYVAESLLETDISDTVSADI